MDAAIINKLVIYSWVLIGLAFICFVVAVIGTIYAIMNRVMVKRIHKDYNRRFDEVLKGIEQKTKLNHKILTEVKLSQAQISNASNNNSRSESNGGNQKGGHQTVNVNTNQDLDGDAKKSREFETYFYQQIGGMREKQSELIKHQAQLIEKQENDINWLKEVIMSGQKIEQT